MTARPTSHAYRVTAATNGDGTSTIHTKQRRIDFDSSPFQGEELPGPADLLTAALAACVLKNVERFGDTLHFHWRAARIAVDAERQDTPPKITRIRYRLAIDTDEPDHRLELLHRNIRKHGAITNTLAAACDVAGEIVAIRPVGTPDRSGPLPAGLEYIRTTPEFDNDTVPAGLLRAHHIADGVWGRLNVRVGALRFVFEDEPEGTISLAEGDTLAIPPGRLHHVELDGPVRFAIEFHCESEQTPPPTGTECTGLT